MLLDNISEGIKILIKHISLEDDIYIQVDAVLRRNDVCGASYQLLK